MSELREAAQAALEHWDKVSGIFRMTTETNRLRAALAQPKTKLRDQHKAFAEWFLQQNPIAPNVEDMAWSAWKAALAAPENRPCTCHPDDNPPQPCAQRYALTECKALAQPETTAEPVAWLNRHHAAMVTQDHATAAVMGFTTPLYAHPPRDEWRLASEPPEDGRDVVVWMNDGGHGCFAIGHCLRGAWTPNYVGSPVTHWRDVQPPTEGER